MKYLILPDCSDHNRGDQALIWETIRIAKDAGFEGEYFMQNDGYFDCAQSKKEGIQTFAPILKHPSRNKSDNNVNYKSVYIKWGVKAMVDLLSSLFVLFISRYSFLHFLLGEEIRKTIDLYKSASGAFVKGGGFIHSFGGPTAFYFIYYHLYPLYLANRLGVPIYIMPNSFGPIDGFLCKWQVRQALKRCKIIYCREDVSCQYMIRNFPGIEFKKSFDFGLHLQTQKRELKLNLPQNKQKIAITVRPYRFPEHTNGDELYKNYINQIAEFCKYLINENFYIVLVQHTLAKNAHEDDLHAAKEISALLPQGRCEIFADESFNCREMKYLYSQFDYIVGTRFHSVIFSMMERVPPLAIAYGGNKTRGIMNDLGLNEYVIGIDEVTKDKMIELFRKIVSNRTEICHKLSNARMIAAEERIKIINELKTFIQ
ncbi:MAG: polysaccharide pyruvyl transferase family protein [Bacteroidaceae bacterium]|nr:polysaccharide pyruvyl transferase family protein [Bacteroidaceae bacterium]